MRAPEDPVACYRELGTTLLTDVHSTDLTRDLELAARELQRELAPDASPGGTWPDAPPAVRAVLLSDSVVNLVRELVGADRVRSASWQLLAWQPGQSTQWHSDQAHVPLTGERVGVWLPVLSRPEGTGLHYYPLNDESGRTVTWSMQPGDVSFHSPFVTHTSRPSTVATMGLATYFFPDGERLQVEPPDGTTGSSARRMLARTTFAGFDDGDVISGDRFPVLP